MGTEGANPLEELAQLARQSEAAATLDSLKPVFARLDHLARLYPGDLDVQLGVDELKAKVVERGKALRQAAPAIPSAPPAPLPEGAKSRAPEAGSVPAPVPEPKAAAPVLDTTKTIATPTARLAHRTLRWKQTLFVGVAIGLLALIVFAGLLVNRARQRNLATALIPVQIATVPSGASIRVNSEPQCTSDCRVSLPAGEYQVAAFLEGYEPAAISTRIAPGKPATLNLILQPARQSIRILTDLAQGNVSLDGQPPAELQDGQFVFGQVSTGLHTVEITSKIGEATFNVQIADAQKPIVSGPMAVKNLMAVLVSTVGGSARVVTSSGPLKLALNGQPQADATSDGVDLTGYQPGVAELLVGEGKDQRNMKETFGPAPALTAFFKSDLNIGTLIVSAGDDDVRVFLNNKEYPRRTQRGQVRIPTIGKVNVRVSKDGYETVAPQTAEVKKGAEIRLEFKLQPLPRMAVLQIRGATPGVEVLLDQKAVGTVGADGAFTDNAVAPGDHSVELRRDQYLPRRMTRSFRAGQTVAIAGADAVLTAALGTVKLSRTPTDAAITYRRADENAAHEMQGNQVELPPGAYVFTARAPGFTEKSERVQLNVGETHTVEIALARVVVAAAPPPPPKVGGMADFENAAAWTQQGSLWSHRGGGFIPYKLTPNGVFTFTIELLRGGNLFRGGRIRWVFQYIDSKNYDLFELDRKSLSSKVMVGGKTLDRGKFDHNLSDKERTYTIQIDSRREHLVTKAMTGGQWKTVDSWDEQDRDFTAGKFGFLVQGNEEIGLSDFKFMPR